MGQTRIRNETAMESRPEVLVLDPANSNENEFPSDDTVVVSRKSRDPLVRMHSSARKNTCTRSRIGSSRQGGKPKGLKKRKSKRLTTRSSASRDQALSRRKPTRFRNGSSATKGKVPERPKSKRSTKSSAIKQRDLQR